MVRSGPRFSLVAVVFSELNSLSFDRGVVHIVMVRCIVENSEMLCRILLKMNKNIEIHSVSSVMKFHVDKNN
jgi:hypothetical protein